MRAPVLEGDARRAVEHRGSHLQILASAGSGKTEVLAQRIASLIGEGAAASSIVAFTFTERAASELRARVGARVEAGREAPRGNEDPLSGLFVGTIHGFCRELLITHVPALELHDVLDATRQFAFLTRVGREFGVVPTLGPQANGDVRISDFLRAVDVIENELLDISQLPALLRLAYSDYVSALDRFRFITYGQMILRAIDALDEVPAVRAFVDSLEHVVVDEYQDINPAQESLIAGLSRGGAHVCVVGDDDQAIYQWRGSNVSFSREFGRRYQPTAQYRLTANYRSVAPIVEVADRFAATIEGRIAKQMTATRREVQEGAVVVHLAETDVDEARWIAEQVLELQVAGMNLRDIAVLARSRVAFPVLLAAFKDAGVPVRLNGWTALFEHPIAVCLGRCVAWLGGLGWRGDGEESLSAASDVAEQVAAELGFDKNRKHALESMLSVQQERVRAESSPLDLVDLCYALLESFGLGERDPAEVDAVQLFGAAARFTNLVADYEAVQRRARPSGDVDGGQVGGQDRGLWYVRGLGHLILGYAFGTYEGHEGRIADALDALDVGTVHGAKGLEWPVVFIASVTAQRFPSSQIGRTVPWAVPREVFPAERYEGVEADERRLFYVALTRAKDRVHVSGHTRRNGRRVGASPYLGHVQGFAVPMAAAGRTFEPGEATPSDEVIELSVSRIADYRACPRKYEFRHVLGFNARIAMELGYGRAVHHAIRRTAELAAEPGVQPDEALIETCVDEDFFLPYANRQAHLKMRSAAKGLVKRYFSENPETQGRLVASERTIALRGDGWVLSGRVDAIVETDADEVALVDFKTRLDDEDLTSAESQLKVYAAALRAEGSGVSAALIEDLSVPRSIPVDVSDQALDDTLDELDRLAEALRQGIAPATPGPICRTCDFSRICSSADQSAKSTRKRSGESAKVRSGSL